MMHIFNNCSDPRKMEYLQLDKNLNILVASEEIQRFVDSRDEVMAGKDVRLPFPELIGIEDILIDILQERRSYFELKGIARVSQNKSPLYIDLYVKSCENHLIIFLEDATSRMVLQQTLIQTSNEASLLLRELAASQSYIDNIITSMADALLVTTPSGKIKRVNQATLDLFGYSEVELIGQHISIVITDENFLSLINQTYPVNQGKFFQNYEIICQTKTKHQVFVAFSGAAIETDIEDLQDFVYIGRDITERKRASQREAVEHATTRILSESATLSKATPKILEAICKSLGWELGELWSVDKQDNLLRYVENWHLPEFEIPDFLLVSSEIVFSPGVGLPGRVWASGEPIWVDDVVNEPGFLRNKSALKVGLHGAFGFPINSGREILGVITFFSRKIQFPQSDLLTMMGTIGKQIGQFIKRKQAELALQESEELFQIFMDNSPAVAFMKDSSGRFVYVNKQLERQFNIKQADLQGKTDFDWLPLDVATKVHENDMYVLSTGNAVEIIEIFPTPDKCLSYWLVFKFRFKNPHGQQFVGGVAVDITERQRLEQELFQEKELAQVTLKSIGDAVITTDAENHIKYLNPVAEQLTGWSHNSAQGKPLNEVFKIVHEITREPAENPVEKALDEGRIVGLADDIVLISRNQSEFAIEDSAAPIRASNGEIIGAVIVFHDVTRTRNLSRQLTWQASHDALTGLVNRREFEKRLCQTISVAKAENKRHTLCYMDLDKFKIVNDTCGHIVGDELLRQVTSLFQAQVRSSDTLARLGGDEFAILLKHCSLDLALGIANTLREAVQTFTFVWQEKTFKIGVSIGVVEINSDSQSLTTILRAADAACYAAKNQGRNRVHVYQPDDSEVAQQQGEMQWVTRITEALEENRFRLYFQPIIPTIQSEFKAEHYEVLLRLIDEMGNLLSPIAFIRSAERYNLMQTLDRWVIHKLFATQGQHYREANFDCLYAINLSAASINDDQFIEFIREELTSYEIPPELICFEITESVAIANLGKAAKFIRAVKEIGCRFGLDDFGNGMSSFIYLKNLPVDYIKIDGNFINQIVNHPVDLAIVEAINEIAHVMGVKTIAEFVENQEILEKITLMGVDYAQGYAIAKPQPF